MDCDQFFRDQREKLFHFDHRTLICSSCLIRRNFVQIFVVIIYQKVLAKEQFFMLISKIEIPVLLDLDK